MAVQVLWLGTGAALADCCPELACNSRKGIPVHAAKPGGPFPGLNQTNTGVPSLPYPLQAVAAFNLAAAQLLLQYGANPNGRAAVDGETPLEAAVRALDLHTVQLLLGAGARGRVRDSSGKTALELVLETCTDESLVR